MDNTKNFAKGSVNTGYDNTTTTIALTSGDGARFPATPFNAVWWNATDYTDPSDDPEVEILRVTDRSADTLTVMRGQEGTTAASHNTSGKTYKLLAGLTAGMFNEVGTDLEGKQPLSAELTGIAEVSFDTAPANVIPARASNGTWMQFGVWDIAAGTNYGEVDRSIVSRSIHGETVPELVAVSIWDTAGDLSGLTITDGCFYLGLPFNGVAWAEGDETNGPALFRTSIGAAATDSPALTGTPTAPMQGPGNNTARLATTAFVQQELTTNLASVMRLKGAIDCSANPNYPAATAGWTYRVSVAGKIGGASGVTANIGDMIICLISNAGGVQASVGIAWWIASKTSAFTSSAELAGLVSDETGSGALVFGNSPTLVTPALGTPSALTLTNATGLPLATGVTGTLAVANGGTGATDAATARTNLAVPGYTLTLQSSAPRNPASSQTYYVGGFVEDGNIQTFSSAAIRVPKSGTIKSVYIKASVHTVGGSNTVNHYLRINDSTDVGQIQGAYNVNSFDGSVDNVNQSVAAGDTIALKIVTPDWSWSTPGAVCHYCVVYIE